MFILYTTKCNFKTFSSLNSNEFRVLLICVDYILLLNSISKIFPVMEVLQDYDNADTISIDTLALEEYLQEERAKEITELSTLSKKVCYLHTSLLYYRNTKSKRGAVCYEAWRTMVKKIGSSLDTWRDVGYALGITQADLDYIMNSVKFDPADVVLKVFTQDEKGTLDKILDVFVKMSRFDILKAVEAPLTDLAQCFDKEDSGYHSNSKNTGAKQLVSYSTDLLNDIPPALIKKYVASKEPNRPNQPMLRPPTKKQEIETKNDNPILFLTFAEDGLATAFNVKYYVENWTDVPDVTVLTLNDKRDEVYQNPEKFIREYFEKADIVVPIVTSGYLQDIKSHNPGIPSTSDNLDCKYVNFIYNLIINTYIHANGCMNKKVRSVLPQDCNVDVLRNITLYPDLMPWTFETNFDNQFKAFLKKEFS